MSIRNTAKAVIARDRKILLVKYNTPANGKYYSLPGGGQNQFEPMKDTVVRECLEETGYLIKVENLVGVCEEIYTDEDLREEHYDYSHRIFHAFRCKILSKESEPMECDNFQEEAVWIDVDDLDDVRIRPKIFSDNIKNCNDGFVGTVISDVKKPL